MSQWFRKYNLIGWFLCLFCFHNVYAESPFEHANAVNFPKVLSADEAFDLSYTYRGTTLDLSWKIAPQCYLYRESIKVFIHQQNQALLPLLNEASLPSGKTVHDPALGEQVVYTDRLDLSIDLSSVLTDTKQNPLVIEVEYQGCSENGFCYPPMSKTFNITSHSKKIENIIIEAILEIPKTAWMQTGGKHGKHTEHLGYLLAEMQYLQRTYPNSTW